MPSLFDPDLKLQWAKNHLDLLGEKVALFTKNNKQTTTAYEDIENGWYVLRTKMPQDDAIFKIALIAGDFVSCLRSCLDHLAWQLALFSTPTPSRDICFPICEKDSLDTQLRIVKSTYGIPEQAVSLMKSYQPYRAGDAYKSTHLWRLNKLWNLDKHKHITPHGVVTGWLYVLDGEHFCADFSYSGVPAIVDDVNDGCIMKLPLAAKDYVKFNPDPNAGNVEVKFGSQAEGIELSYSDFIEMYEFVRDKLLPSFAGFFPQPEIGGQQT